MKCYEKCSLWGLYLLNRGCFFGKQSLVQETKLHISGIHELMKSFRRNQLQKPSLIMINIVAKPFWNMSIWTCFHVSSSQNYSEAFKGEQVIWLPSGAIMFLSVWLIHCQSCENCYSPRHARQMMWWQHTALNHFCSSCDITDHLRLILVFCFVLQLQLCRF